MNLSMVDSYVSSTRRLGNSGGNYGVVDPSTPRKANIFFPRSVGPQPYAALWCACARKRFLLFKIQGSRDSPTLPTGIFQAIYARDRFLD